MKTLGIVGFGVFSELIVEHLTPYFKIKVYSRRDVSKIARKLGAKQLPLAEVATCDIVVIAVMAQYFKKTIQQISPMIKSGALVLDVASVKVKPAHLMEKYLPQNTEIIATHPLFGPQSGKNGIAGLRIVLCPIRATNIKAVENFLSQKLKLKVIYRTPEEHDQEMAIVQGLTHFISKGLQKLNITSSEQSTVAYEHLLKTKQLLEEDSDELFSAIQNDNPYAKKIRKQFIQHLAKIHNSLLSKK